MKLKHFFVLLFVNISCQNQKNENNLTIEELIIENKLLNKKNDSLRTILVENSMKNYWFDNDFEGKTLKDNQINNPEKYITNSLEKRKDLIPLKSTLGGTLEFEKIQVLGEIWVIANYSDGHITGRAIYSYVIDNNDKLKFELIISNN